MMDICLRVKTGLSLVPTRALALRGWPEVEADVVADLPAELVEAAALPELLLFPGLPVTCF